MNLRDVTRLVLRLAGLYYLVTVTVSVTITVVALIATPEATWTVLPFANDFVYFVIGAALFWFPGIVLDRVLRIDVEGPIATPRLLEVGLGLLGAYFVIQASYGFIYVIARAKWFYHLNEILGRSTAPDFRPNELAELAACVVQIAIALGVWFWRKQIACLGAKDMMTTNNALEADREA